LREIAFFLRHPFLQPEVGLDHKRALVHGTILEQFSLTFAALLGSTEP
jgi:hypothetical protein